MSEHMRQTLPPHLKKFQGAGTYVPKNVANAMAEHMEKSLPPHMKEYAGAYLQQNVLQPTAARTTPETVSPLAARPLPSPQTVATTQAANVPADSSPDGSAASVQPVTPAQATPEPMPSEVSPDQPYDFITNPAVPPKPSLMSQLPGGNSKIVRVGLIAGGLVVLLIIFAIFKSLLFKGPNLTPLVVVAQDQQEMIHLTTEANAQQGISTNNQNFAATVQLSVASSQGKIISYLAGNHKKVNTKQLNLKVSAATDDQLTAAAAATTYNETFKQVMQNQLSTYAKDLQLAYKEDKGKKGRALLNDTFRQAELLEQQLNSDNPTD